MKKADLLKTIHNLERRINHLQKRHKKHVGVGVEIISVNEKIEEIIHAINASNKKIDFLYTHLSKDGVIIGYQQSPK